MFKTLALAALFLAAAGAAHAQSLDEMAGQMVVVGFQGDGVEDAGVVALLTADSEDRMSGARVPG